MAEVKIGDSTATIAKLNGYKAAEALSIISDITEETPSLLHDLAEFTRTYEIENAQRMPRAAAEAKFPEQAKNVSEEAWQASGNELVVPTPPGLEEQIAFALPKVYKTARESLTGLLSLMLAPNSVTKQADEDGSDLYGKTGALAPYRSQLLHDADLEQLIDLASAVAEVLREQLSNVDSSAVGKAMEVFGLRKPTTPTATPASPEKSAPSDSAPDSASPSAETSDGPEPTSSTEPHSERSEPQPVS